MKCEFCKQKKAKRFCLALNTNICSLCCGENRDIKINCATDCAYWQSGTAFQQNKEINKKITQLIAENRSLDQENDLFSNDKLIGFAYIFENFLCDNFYHDKNFNDDMLFEILSYIYLDKEYNMNNEILKYYNLILKAYNNLGDNEYAGDEKKRVLLRILESIENMSGGIFGNRNYFKVIYSQLHKDGVWTHLFSD